MAIDRRLFTSFDWTLLGLVLGVASLGLVNLYSASHAGGEAGAAYMKQAYWFGFGLAVMIMVALPDYRLLETYAYPLYAVSLLLLLGVLVLGKSVSGGQRWIQLGGFAFQPSETAKVALVAVLSRFFLRGGRPGQAYSLRELMVPAALLGGPFILVALEPDLGTALLMAAIFFSMVLFIGLHWKSLLAVVLSGLAALPVGWTMLKDYQRTRVMTFITPESDPLGAGYHAIQSKIAVGSGMLTGKGYLKGTQAHLYFLPERHTDFIFSVWAEEWGFLGCTLVVCLYAALVVWGLNISRRSRERFGRLLALGLTANIFWQAVVNIGMVLGVLPVVGVPLPLFSYGGSSLISTMISIGLLMSVSMRRFMFQR
ncbi:MAG: rod shape-determining protein RodA [Pseudomonadota bacterium]